MSASHTFTVHRTWDGQFRLEENGLLSEPMSAAALVREISLVAVTQEDKGWSKPLVHRPKRALPAQTPPADLYEIHKGKVRRIPTGVRGDRLRAILAQLDITSADLEL